MDKNISKLGLEYWQKGSNPSLLIHTGTHGDEYSVIELVENFLTEHKEEMCDFVWVPRVSPSACRLKARNNERGNNLNHMFVGEIIEPEALANLELLSPFKFKNFLSIHEDLTADKFYMYEMKDNSKTSEWQKLFVGLKSRGINLYQGLDDPNDPALCNEIKDGYFSYAWQKVSTIEKDPFFESYIFRNHLITGKDVTAEVPGLLIAEKKKIIIELLFKYICA
ncbi:MAG: succinylglutamate desuccinylase/aspartoacylase family protein [Candidatus Magasanikbacteria bacterium]|nr:succinylglutamate desuccinylase/aspartoacylase family protein [Candidatus Magasanikbacteria bacterium]